MPITRTAAEIHGWLDVCLRVVITRPPRSSSGRRISRGTDSPAPGPVIGWHHAAKVGRARQLGVGFGLNSEASGAFWAFRRGPQFDVGVPEGPEPATTWGGETPSHPKRC